MSKRESSSLKRILEEFTRFQTTMEELHFLKQVSNDLKSFRKMLKLKKYD
ncbi:MAG: hypothetical protein ACP5IM_04170 [Candidatus Bathyarchaeia archaeon]